MKRLLLACLLAPNAYGADLDSLPSEEVCVLFSLTLATGQSTYAGSQAELKDALTARGEKCEPKEVYMQAALQRAQNLQAKATADAIVAADNARAAQMQSMYDQQQADQARRDRSRALMELSDKLLNPPRATTTNCQSTLLGMTCSTY